MRKPSTSNNPTPDFLKVSCQKYGEQDFLTLLDGLLPRMRKVENAILPRSLNHNDTKTTAGVWLDWHIRFKQGRILLHKKWVHSRYFCLCEQKHLYSTLSSHLSCLEMMSLYSVQLRCKVFDVCVRNCMLSTHTSKSNLTLGTVSRTNIIRSSEHNRKTRKPLNTYLNQILYVYLNRK